MPIRSTSRARSSARFRRWQYNPAGHHPVLVRAGQFINERKVAEGLKYQVEPARSGRTLIVMRTGDPNGACGVASDAAGVVVLRVNPHWYRRLRAGDQADGADADNQRLRWARRGRERAQLYGTNGVSGYRHALAGSAAQKEVRG